MSAANLSASRGVRAAVTLTAVASVFSFASPGSALGQSCQGAPGASAIQQYCEAVPRADGGREEPASSGGESAGTPSISKKTGSALERSGTDGAAVKRLATGGQTPKKSGNTSAAVATTEASGAVRGTTIEGPSNPSGSPLRAATKAVESGPTAGAGLTWGLVGMSTLGVVGALFFRRNRQGLELDDEV